MPNHAAFRAAVLASAQPVGPDVMTDILAIGTGNSLADLAYIWHTGSYPARKMSAETIEDAG